MRLTLLYARGEGWCKELVIAHMWLRLSAKHGEPQAAAERDRSERPLRRNLCTNLLSSL